MQPQVVEARVRAELEQLRLRRMAGVLDRVCADAAAREESYLAFLDALLTEEIDARYVRTVETKTRLAHLPFRKTIGDFDFAAQPSVAKKQIAELATLRFIDHAENVVFLGPPGVGKTHLAVALATEAIAKGASAYFVTLPQLIDYLAEGTEPAAARMRVLLYQS